MPIIERRVSIVPLGCDKTQTRTADYMGLCLVRDFDKDIPLLRGCKDEISNWKGDIGVVVECILVEDDFSPGLVEVPGGHVVTVPGGYRLDVNVHTITKDSSYSDVEAKSSVETPALVDPSSLMIHK